MEKEKAILVESAKENAGAEEVEEEEKPTAPQKDDIVFEDFMKMDIRVGKILSAKKVKKADKLLELLVDTGLDKRTIVSGIAEYFTPEELPGKQVCVLANLEPRVIKGITSQGMILLAEDSDGKLIFVSPENTVRNGSSVN